MKYYEFLAKTSLINQIPLTYNGKSLNANTAVNVVLLKVKNNKAIEEVNTTINDALKELKKEGYDDREAAIKEMNRVFELVEKANNWKEGDIDNEGNLIPKPTMPSKEDIKKAEETKGTEEAFKEEQKELIIKYNNLYSKKLQEEVAFGNGISKEDWKSIYDMIGTEGEIEYKYSDNNIVPIPTSLFLQYIGELIVE